MVQDMRAKCLSAIQGVALSFLLVRFSPCKNTIRDRLCWASRDTKPACRALLFVDDRVKQSVEQNSIIDTGLLTGVAYDPMVRHTCIQRYGENSVEAGSCLTVFQREHTLPTAIRTRFAKCTPILLKSKGGCTVICYKNNLFITRSNTTLAFTRGALILKKRFRLSIRRPHQKRRFLFGSCKRLGKRFKKISSVCHYLTPSSIISDSLECDLNSSVNPSDLKVFPTAVLTFACGAWHCEQLNLP